MNAIQFVGLIVVRSANDSWTSLSSLAEIIEPNARNRSEFIKECTSGRLDNVSVIFRTFESIEITGRFDEEILEALPASVRFICHNGEGWNFHDHSEAD